MRASAPEARRTSRSPPSSSRFASSWIQPVTSVSAGPPWGGLYLNPPSPGGLCDGVTTMPSAVPRPPPRLWVRIAREMTGVGVAPPSASTTTSTPCALRTSTIVCTAGSESACVSRPRKSGPSIPCASPLAADGLGDRGDVGLGEGAVERRAAVARRAEGDALLGIGRVGPLVVVGGKQALDVHQVVRTRQLSSAWIGPFRAHRVVSHHLVARAMIVTRVTESKHQMAFDARRPTMKDVAARARVSLATVSRVVNGRDDVATDLQARVRKAIEELGYRRDLTASTLRRADRTSSIIGLVHEDVGNPFFAAVHRGVEEVARARGVLTISGSSDEDPEREHELADAFTARGVDGLIIAPCGTDQSYLAPEVARGTRVVFVDRPPRGLAADCVTSDNAGGARTGVAHLVAAGHRRIGFLGDWPAIPTAADRLAGYRRALTDAGVPHDPELERLHCTGEQRAAQAAAELLEHRDPPTALFTAQNLITAGALRTLRALGLQHAVALVGLDDLELADLMEPGITVVRQDPVALGRRAAELLFARLDGDAAPPRGEVLGTELVVRGSGELAPPVLTA